MAGRRLVRRTGRDLREAQPHENGPMNRPSWRGVAAGGAAAVWAAAVTVGGTACVSRRPAAAAERPASVWRTCGRVAHVNRAEGYVILECPLAPAAGRVERLLREGRAVAEVRVTARRQGDYVAAEIRSGEPQVGDVLEKRTVGME